jgi:hypothetical protein
MSHATKKEKFINCSRIIKIKEVVIIKKIILILITLLVISSVTASMKENLQQEITTTDTSALTRVKFLLPLQLKLISTETNEVVFIKINKNTQVEFLQELKKQDLEIKATEQTLLTLLTSPDVDESILNEMEVSASSFKGRLMINFIEDLFDVEIEKEKDFSDRAVGLMIKPATFFINRLR